MSGLVCKLRDWHRRWQPELHLWWRRGWGRERRLQLLGKDSYLHTQCCVNLLRSVSSAGFTSHLHGQLLGAGEELLLLVCGGPELRQALFLQESAV